MWVILPQIHRLRWKTNIAQILIERVGHSPDSYRERLELNANNATDELMLYYVLLTN